MTKARGWSICAYRADARMAWSEHGGMTGTPPDVFFARALRRLNAPDFAVNSGAGLYHGAAPADVCSVNVRLGGDTRRARRGSDGAWRWAHWASCDRE